MTDQLQSAIKVYELAKELGLASMVLLDHLKKLKIEVKSHMSSLTEDEVTKVRDSLKPKENPKKIISKTAPKTVTKTAPVKIVKKAATSKPSAASEIPKSTAPSTPVTRSHIIRRKTVGEDTLPVSTKDEQQPTLLDESPAQETNLAAVEQAVVETAPTTAPQPVKRNLLNIVHDAPKVPPIIKKAPVQPTPAATTAQDALKKTSRIIQVTKENLDALAEEEAAKKRGANTRERAPKPEDVRFADYKKREVVFMPKKKRIPVGKEIRQTQITQPKALKRIVEMQEAISVQDIANQMGLKTGEVLKKLMSLGQMASINQALDFDTATLLANEFGWEVKNVGFNESKYMDVTADTPENLKIRPPIVTIMGHVDHGKTTLLDAIRESSVAASEAGGITQHIGAYTVEKNGKKITFIDTPGHAAFTTMRARGANVTDIVILVVAADDGVMPQTREALSHARAAKVPIIVAVNKIDKPGANPEKIKQALAELNVLAEDWGGDTMFVGVSALKKTGLDQLLEAILLNTEVLDLKANVESLASGVILESRLDKGKGPVATALIKRGTLRTGHSIVSGSYAGRVRWMTDFKGAQLKEAGPGTAVEVVGLNGVPQAGEPFFCAINEESAQMIIANRIHAEKLKASAPKKVTLDDLFTKIEEGSIKDLKVVLKTDAFGSLEAIRESLSKLSTSKVKVSVIHAATGGITESDVMLASASHAIIIGFNVRPESNARTLAEREAVEIKNYSIIYELIDEIKLSMAGLLDKKKVEHFLGRAQVRQPFSVPKLGTIAGSSVTEGKITRSANARLLRDSRVIYEGKIVSLRRFKDDAKEVATGFECGIGLDSFNDLKPGDVIEAYEVEMVSQELS